MRYTRLCSLLAAATFAGVAACGEETSFPVLPVEDFAATLNGANEVPTPVTTNATGTAVLGVIQDTILTFRLDVASIDSTTLAHIHEGTAAVAGGVIVTLYVGPSACTATSASPRCREGYSGNLSQGQFRPGQLTQLPAGYGATPLERFNTLVDLMRTGGVYVNVHNRAFPGGVIRGQVVSQ